MKKLSIPFFFFTLSLFIASTGFAQSIREFSRPGSITANGDISNPGSISLGGALHLDSSFVNRLGSIIPHHLKAPSKYYYEKDGERYYIDNSRPTVKGKQVDHSNVWLLHDEVPKVWR